MLPGELAFANACPSNGFLDEMAKGIPWDLFEQDLKRQIRHKSGGRPPYCRLLLFKRHWLQVWYGLSDAATEFQCQDRLSFRQFLGRGIDDSIPKTFGMNDVQPA